MQSEIKQALKAIKEERYATAEVLLEQLMQRPWAELSKAEIRQIANDNLTRVDPGEVDFAFALEAKIKEKNT